MSQANIPTKTLYVFQTSRQANKFLSDNVGKLLHVMSLTEFFDKTAFVKSKTKISNSAAIAMLLKAAKSVDMGKLGFSKNFLDFLATSDFLFSFFEELKGEEVSIDDIRGEDVYAAFEDHLEVLEELFAAYKRELDSAGLYDFITADELSINTDYLANFDEVVVKSMGLFTMYELRLLDIVSKAVPTKLKFTLDRYNAKMAGKFARIGLEITNESGILEIDMSAKRLISSTPATQNMPQLSAYRLKNRIYEAPFAMSKIAEFLDKGYKPENIAVILPDEGFANLLSLFDKHSNLNFAFGESVSKSQLFAAFEALLSHANGKNDPKRLEALGVLALSDTFAQLGSLHGFEHLKKALTTLLDTLGGDKAVREMFERAVFEFECESEIFGALSSAEIGYIMLSHIAKAKIDDSRGGKIRVMGVLESRGIELEGAVIVDMNEEFFPKRLDKDLFLNTKIKERAGIPTNEDRQNLQKHFFLELMNNTKECVFAFVENDESSPSPFLYELGLIALDVDEESLEKLYFSQAKRAEVEPIKYNDSANLYEQYKSANQKDRLSVSAFCDYLKCERFFYFRYVMRLIDEDIDEADETAIKIGNAFHKAMEQAYKDGTKANLPEYVKAQMIACEPSLFGSFEFDLFISGVGAFFEHEEHRASHGFVPKLLEYPLSAEIDGVCFDARVDRIDEKDGELYVIDYKTGQKEIKPDSDKKAENSSKYQLALYTAMLFRSGKPAKSAFYYDVLRGRLVEETTMHAKLEHLPFHIARFLSKPNFEVAKDKASCRFCEYALICGVGIGAAAEDGEDE